VREIGGLKGAAKNSDGMILGGDIINGLWTTMIAVSRALRGGDRSIIYYFSTQG